MINISPTGVVQRSTRSEDGNIVRNLGNILVDTVSALAPAADYYIAEASGNFDLVINMDVCAVGKEVTFQWSIDTATSLLTIQEAGVVVATQIPVIGVMTNTAFNAFAAPSTNAGGDVPATFAAGVLANAAGTVPITLVLTLRKVRANSAAGTRDGWSLLSFYAISA